MDGDRADRVTPAPTDAGRPRRRRLWRRALKALAWTLVVLVGLLLITGWLLRRGLESRLASSLPATDGEARLAGLASPVLVERDALGVPTLRASNRVDLARALGYLHGQDRFFQMDLVMRRRGAGELAGLLGPLARSWDRAHRPQRLRALAQRVLTELPPDERALVDAYAEGVNAGLASLGSPPFEYFLLAVEPQPWKPEDTLLAVLSMFQELQAYTQRYEIDLGLMHDLLPPALVEFLTPGGTEWDAPLQGEPVAPPGIPRPAAVDLERLPKAAGLVREPWPAPVHPEERVLAGSNGWAVDGGHGAGGRALLANDIHLGTSVPNIWYRASFVWPAEDGSGEHRVTGVTLPGIPVMVVGSNRRVAWSITSSLVDTSDIVLLDLDPEDPEVYLTPDGPRRFEHFSEPIEVNWWGDETLDVRWTGWGPVIGEDHRGRLQVLRWVAYEPGAVNLSSHELETAETLDEALEVARRGGAPAQNFIAADADGRIGWTLLGRLPRRVGFDGRLPSSWADGGHRWEGLLPAAQVPLIADPPEGRLWSANNRPVGGEMQAKLGDGGYRSGARARQIRDGLFALPAATEEEMLALQLDDRALFLERWHRLLTEVLTPEAVAGHPGRRDFRQALQNWEGRASVDSVSYRLVRSFRLFLIQQVSRSLTAPCREADPRFDYENFGAVEGPIWELASQQPEHLLDPRHESWQEQFLAVVDQILAYYEARDDGLSLSQRTWGRFNTTAIHHPLSQLLPPLAERLDMPPRQLPGDVEMPRVQLPSFGSTLRMVVSPGREEEGFFHMPGGQSGHPASAHYRDAHRAWAEGEPTPLLPGPVTETLTLQP